MMFNSTYCFSLPPFPFTFSFFKLPFFPQAFIFPVMLFNFAGIGFNLPMNKLSSNNSFGNFSNQKKMLYLFKHQTNLLIIVQC